MTVRYDAAAAGKSPPDLSAGSTTAKPHFSNSVNQTNQTNLSEDRPLGCSGDCSKGCVLDAIHTHV